MSKDGVLTDAKTGETKMMDNPSYKPVSTTAGNIHKSLKDGINNHIKKRVSPFVKTLSDSFVNPPNNTLNNSNDSGSGNNNNSPKSSVNEKTNHNNSFYSKNSNKFNATSITNN